MRWRIARLKMALWRAGGVDVVITHSPPRGVGDQDDPAHIGFKCMLKLIERYHPLYLLHGHVHLSYNVSMKREHEYQGTKVINVSERYILDLPDRQVPASQRNELIWKSHYKEPSASEYYSELK